MNTYFSFFMPKSADNSFFMGANTPKGFVSNLSDYISEESFDALYILKGGPGTGKSTLMKKLCELFSDNSYTLRCSSDTDSLDAVIIEKNNKKIAVIDGTAPHITDPKYPGACSTVVDLGAFFDRGMLRARKTEIIEAVRKKSAAFRSAYAYLDAAERFVNIRSRYTEKAFLREKAEGYAKRLAKSILCSDFKNKKGAVKRRQTLAFSYKGAVRLNTFDKAAVKILIKDYASSMSAFSELLSKEAANLGATVLVSESPLGGIGEIYIEDCDTLISPFILSGEEKSINMKRFIDKDKLLENKAKMSFAGKCFDMALSSALDNLREAGKVHGELEKIYTPCVDFSMVDIETEKILSDILALP